MGKALLAIGDWQLVRANGMLEPGTPSDTVASRSKNTVRNEPSQTYSNLRRDQNGVQA